MKPISRKLALWLNLTVLPGLGHWYYGLKLRGALWMGLTTLTAVSFCARLSWDLFYWLHRSWERHDPIHRPVAALIAAWRQDSAVLLTFLLLLSLLWVLPALDLWFSTKEKMR